MNFCVNLRDIFMIFFYIDQEHAEGKDVDETLLAEIHGNSQLHLVSDNSY